MNEMIKRQNIRKGIAVLMAVLMMFGILPDFSLQVRAEGDKITVRVTDDAGEPVAGADIRYKIVQETSGAVSGSDVSGGDADDETGISPLELSGSDTTDSQGEIEIEISGFTESMTISLEISKEGFGKRIISGQPVDNGGNVDIELRKEPQIQVLNGEYNGEEQEVVTKIDNILDDDRILYSTDNVDWQEEVPKRIDAGEYSVYVKVLREGYEDFVTGELKAVIEKAKLVDVGAEPYQEVYDGEEHPALTFSKLETGDRVTCTYTKDETDAEVSFVYDGMDSIEVPLFQNAGKYPVKVTVERDNHEAYEEFFTIIITPASIADVTVTLRSGLIYNGQDQELLEKIDVREDDKVFYVLGDSEDWVELTEEQKPQGCDAGDYKVRIKVLREDNNYEETEIALDPAEVSIQKAVPNLKFKEGYTEDIVYFDAAGSNSKTLNFAVECDAEGQNQKITYHVENVAEGDETGIADIASIAESGELTVLQAGHVIKITASTEEDKNYEKASVTCVLVIQETDKNLISFQESEIKILLGTSVEVSTQTAGKLHEDDNGVVTYTGKVEGIEGDLESIGIELDSSTGEVSVKKLELLSSALETDGSLSVVITATKGEGTKKYGGDTLTVYAACQANYTITISTENIPDNPYKKCTMEDKEILPGDLKNGWHNTLVKILPADGYSIVRDSVSDPYDDYVVFGDRPGDQGEKTRVIYLRNKETNAITRSIIIDLERLDNVKPYNLHIDFPETEERDGIKYYDGDVKIVFTANDDTSGVKCFHWSYERLYGSDSILEAASGELQAVQDETDKTKYTAVLTLPRQAAEQMRGYLTMYAEDTAGNKSETLEDTGTFVVDTISPYQSVRYRMTNEGGTYQTIGTRHYFSDAVEFEFKITETNFFPEDVHVTVSRNGGQAAEQGVTWVSTGAPDEYEARIMLAEDGDYIVHMTYMDRSGHEMLPYTSETIVIDTTAPVIDFHYAGNNGENPQMATITVTEHNFRQSDIVVMVDAKTITDQGVLTEDLQNYLRNCQWVDEGDVHTAFLSDQLVDAIYVLTCNYNDMALNPAAEVITEPFIVDHTPPAAERMSVTYSNPLKDTVLSAITLGFYNPDVTITFTAYDDTAGIEYFTWSYIRQEGVSAENVELYADTRITAVQDPVDKAKYTASLTLPRSQAEQLRGMIAFTATDKYGNISDKLTDNRHVIVVDSISPVMTAEYSVPDNVFGEKSYYNKALTATFTVTEANFYREDVVVMLTKDDGAAVEIVPDWIDASADVHVGTYVIEAPESHANDGDYVFTISYTDRSNNAMSVYTSDRFVIDTISPVFNIEYSNQDPVNILTDGDGNERRYFPGELSATLMINEHNFNVENVRYLITATDIAGNELDAESLYEISAWDSDGDVHTATILYSGEANYSFDIEYIDLALHEMEDYTMEFFTVDMSMPTELAVSYSTSILDTILANISFGFYDAQVTVDITATDTVSGVYGFEYSYLRAEGVSAINTELTEQILNEAQITFSDGGATGTASFQIPQSVLGAANQFNGTVRFSATDRAGNKTDDFQDTKRIVVDNIAPTANVEYNAPVQSINNISYYDGDINATITINEANFYPEDVTVSVTRDGAEYAVVPVWSENNTDNHTGTFTLTGDGDYFVNIAYTDKSGNIMQQYVSEQMTIDTKIEEATITVNGIDADGKAFKDEVVVAVSFEDKNFENYEIVLMRTNFGIKNIDVTEQFIVEPIITNAVGGSGSFDTFTKTAENDGIYTMIVRLSDKAGHAVEKKATFTVNRYGSVYEYNDYLMELIQDGGAYVQSVQDDLVITEYNADRLVSQSLNIEISRDGKPLDSYDYKVTPEINDAVAIGPSGWYQYQYTIEKENFAADGVYKISVSSRDETGNTPENTNYDNKAILFRVDSTSPEINSITGLESSIVNATSLEIRYIVYDTIGLESVSVFVDGEEKEDITDFAGDVQNYSGSIILAESPQAQNVRLVVRDLAGNVTDTDADDFTSAFAFNPYVTVSTNIIVRWFANKTLFWGSIGGTVAVIGAGTGGLVLFRRKRKLKAKAK